MQRKYNSHGAIISARTSVCHEKVLEKQFRDCTALSVPT